MASFFDINVLSCLLDPRYLNFKLCAKIESVSTLFHRHALKYYSRVKRIDFDHFRRSQAEKSNINLSQLINKLIKRCSNIEKIEKFAVEESNLEEFEKLTNFPNLSSLEIASFKGDQPVLAAVREFKKLKELKIGRWMPKSERGQDGTNLEKFKVHPKISVDTLYLCDKELLICFDSNGVKELHFQVEVPLDTNIDYNIKLDKITSILPQYLEIPAFNLYLNFSDEFYNESPLSIHGMLEVVQEKKSNGQFSLSVDCNAFMLRQLMEIAQLPTFLKRLHVTGHDNREYLLANKHVEQADILGWASKLTELCDLRWTGRMTDKADEVFSLLPKLKVYDMRYRTITKDRKSCINYEIRAVYQKEDNVRCQFSEISIESSVPESEAEQTEIFLPIMNLLEEKIKEDPGKTLRKKLRKFNIVNPKRITFKFEHDDNTDDKIKIVRAVAKVCPKVSILHLDGKLDKDLWIAAAVCFRKITFLSIFLPKKDASIENVLENLEPFFDLAFGLTKIDVTVQMKHIRRLCQEKVLHSTMCRRLAFISFYEYGVKH